VGILFAETVPVAIAIVVAAQQVAEAILQLAQILGGLPLVIVARSAFVQYCTWWQGCHLPIIGGCAIVVLRQKGCEGLAGVPPTAILVIAIPIQRAVSIAGLSTQRLHLGCRLHIAIALRHLSFIRGFPKN